MMNETDRTVNEQPLANPTRLQASREKLRKSATVAARTAANSAANSGNGREAALDAAA
jgi:hypothetical protein